MRRWKKGDVLRADELNKLVDEATRLGKISTEAPIEAISLPNGIHLRLADIKPMWAKVTSGTNPYAWTEQKPKAGGLFEDLPGGRTGTTSQDPAYEFASYASVPANTIVKMERSYTTGEWMFDYGPC